MLFLFDPPLHDRNKKKFKKDAGSGKNRTDQQRYLDDVLPNVHFIAEVLGEDVLPLLLRHKGRGVHRTPAIVILLKYCKFDSK
jgi:hypothetical protein